MANTENYAGRIEGMREYREVKGNIDGPEA